MAKRNGAALIIINREATDFDAMADLVVRDDIGDVLEPFLVALMHCGDSPQETVAMPHFGLCGRKRAVILKGDNSASDPGRQKRDVGGVNGVGSAGA